MKIIDTAIADIKIFEPIVFSDERGFFFESFNHKKFENLIGRSIDFVQDNQSHSVKGTLRGLHYQIVHPQGKLIRVIDGEVFDVAVDLRRASKTFGSWVGVVLSAENKRQLWIPEGFAHGFYVLSNSAEFLYKTTDYWFPQHERILMWNDPRVNIQWPLNSISPILSAKDANAIAFEHIETFER